MAARVVWSHKTAAPVRGLSQARERGWLLAWNAQHRLSLFNHKGERQAQFQPRGALVAACCADDGKSFAAVGGEGQVWLLAPDLMPRWERSVGQRAVAVALAPFGQLLAVSDGGGGLHLFDASGKLLWHQTCPRALKQLLFVPERPLLVGAADYGLVACFNEKGETVWRDGLVANSGSLACSGDGSLIALACFSDGLWCYNQAGKRSQLPQLAPCRLADLSYAGDLILTAGLENQVRLQSRDGLVRAGTPVEGTPLALALSPLADHGWVGLAENLIVCLNFPW